MKTKEEIDLIPHEVNYERLSETQQKITFNNPYGLGTVIMEYDDPVSLEQLEIITLNFPKLFYEKEGKLLGFEDQLGENIMITK